MLVAGLALLGAPGFVLIRYAAAILAAIIAVFAFQARQWWWLPVLAAIVVLWNPVVPFDFAGRWWQIAQLAGAAAFALAAVLIRQPDPDAQG
ncbi:DUF6804 family protein [uncultured Amnibacterium sp.]|uniref:DUF6804 family protein n=1 Tax=uncultured Amnibacterium sp. TaxID=1631851 RepID=UPI0035CB4587